MDVIIYPLHFWNASTTMGAQVITYLLSDNIDIWHHGISRESLPLWLGCSTAVILGHLLAWFKCICNATSRTDQGSGSYFLGSSGVYLPVNVSVFLVVSYVRGLLYLLGFCRHSMRTHVICQHLTTSHLTMETE